MSVVPGGRPILWLISSGGGGWPETSTPVTCTRDQIPSAPAFVRGRSTVGARSLALPPLGQFAGLHADKEHGDVLGEAWRMDSEVADVPHLRGLLHIPENRGDDLPAAHAHDPPEDLGARLQGVGEPGVDPVRKIGGLRFTWSHSVRQPPEGLMPSACRRCCISEEARAMGFHSLSASTSALITRSWTYSPLVWTPRCAASVRADSRLRRVGHPGRWRLPRHPVSANALKRLRVPSRKASLAPAPRRPVKICRTLREDSGLRGWETGNSKRGSCVTL